MKLSVAALEGRFLAHAAGTLVLCWRRMLRAAGVAALAGILLVEILDCVAARHFPPSGAAQLVALALALALAYGAAGTVLAIELFAGVFEAVRVLEGDGGAGLAATAALAATVTRRGPGAEQRDPHAAATPARGLGLREIAVPLAGSRNVRRPVAPASGPSDPTIPLEEAATPPLPPLPVRADRLPRIGWAAEPLPGEREQPRAPEGRPEAYATEDSPEARAPWQTPRSAASSPLAAPALPAGPAADPMDGSAPSGADTAPAAAVAPDTPPELDLTGTPAIVPVRTTSPSGSIAPSAGAGARAPGSAATRPIAGGAATRPLPPPRGPFDTTARPGGVWGRLGQALIGHVHELPILTPEPTPAEPQTDDGTPPRP